MKLVEAEQDHAVCVKDLRVKRAALNTVLAQLESLNKSFKAKKKKKLVKSELCDFKSLLIPEVSNGLVF